MKLKTYRAQSMADALAQVKKDLGREAVILHTRMFKHGGFFGFGARDMVEVTASDSVNVGATLRSKGRAAVDATAETARPRPAAKVAGSGRGSEHTSRVGATITQSGDERSLLSSAAANDRAARQNVPSARDLAQEPAATAAGLSPAKSAYSNAGSSAPDPRVFQRPSGAPAGKAARDAAGGGDRGVGGVDGGGMGNAGRGAGVESIVMPVHNSRGGVRLDADQASGIRAAARMAIEPGSGSSEELRAELSVIRRMVGQVLQSSARASIGGPGAAPALKMSDALVKHYSRLIENEVAQEVADEVVGAVRDELSPAELADDGIVRLAILRRLETLLPVCDDVASPKPGEDGRPLTIALVGPTGVGKTTTIAKLAAAYRLRHGKRVTLITTDTYRIAAVDQLRTYANIIGVPLRVVMTPSEMEAAIEASSQTDVILIDTAGRSPGDAPRLDELRAFLRAAKPHQTHLVLSSVSSEGSMVRTAERFAELKPNLLIFTKLDEAANLGVLVNVARRVNARLSYVTTGQEVPDDIEPGRADRLARLVLDGKNTPVAGGA